MSHPFIHSFFIYILTKQMSGIIVVFGNYCHN
jgi:hypothetical protein